MPASDGLDTVRLLVRYITCALIATGIVYMIWALVCGCDSQIAVSSHPELAKTLEEMQNAPLEPQNIVALLSQLQPYMHTFLDALLSSVLGFYLVGFMVGRWCSNASYAGIIPCCVLITGLNPAMLGGVQGNVQGLNFSNFSLGERCVILFVQILAVHVSAWHQHIKCESKLQKAKSEED